MPERKCITLLVGILKRNIKILKKPYHEIFMMELIIHLKSCKKKNLIKSLRYFDDWIKMPWIHRKKRFCKELKTCSFFVWFPSNCPSSKFHQRRIAWRIWQSEFNSVFEKEQNNINTSSENMQKVERPKIWVGKNDLNKYIKLRTLSKTGN